MKQLALTVDGETVKLCAFADALAEELQGWAVNTRRLESRDVYRLLRAATRRLTGDVETVATLPKGLTQEEREQLERLGLRVELVPDRRFKRRKVIFSTPTEPPVCRWALWKAAWCEGRLVRLPLDQQADDAFWRLARHYPDRRRNRWQPVDVDGTVDECLCRAIRRDFLGGGEDWIWPQSFGWHFEEET